MKYEDLSRMYWDIHQLWTDICDIHHEDSFPIDRNENNINWVLSTIHEELRDLESIDRENLY